MADQGSRRNGGSQGRSGSSPRKPSRSGGAGGRSSSASGRPDRGGRSDRNDRNDRRSRDGAPAQRGQGGQRGKGEGRDPARERGDRSREQAIYDGPPLPEEITGKELAPEVRNQLKGLPEKLAARVARHLAAAGALIDSDPETAYQHTRAARARASRLAVVREAAGEAAYAAGHFAEALAELRAAKRMNGATAYLPIMADCHRALGNAQQALELAKSPAVAKFAAPAKAEMTIVEAGARRDLGQFDAALRTLELAPLNSQSREAWVVRLRYAYADTLEQAGRPQDALTWFHKTHAIDGEELTDAEDRVGALERQLEG